MSEQYVSFEVAKLLREKGFRGDCIAYYNDDGKKYLSLNADLHPLPCPTQAVACSWLREVHNIFVTVIPSELSGIIDYTYVIYRVGYSNHNFKVVHQGRPRKGSKRPCEDAVELALEYALKNLIEL